MDALSYAHDRHKKKDFSFAFKNKLASNNFFYRGLYISLYVIKEREPQKYTHVVRTGFAISKKIGKATKRNKIKRQLRTLAKSSILNINSVGYYYIILAGKDIMQANYQNLQKDLITCIKKIK